MLIPRFLLLAIISCLVLPASSQAQRDARVAGTELRALHAIYGPQRAAPQGQAMEQHALRSPRRVHERFIVAGTGRDGAITPDSKVPVYIYVDSTDRVGGISALEGAGVQVNKRYGRVLTGVLPLRAVPALEGLRGVRKVLAQEKVRVHDGVESLGASLAAAAQDEQAVAAEPNMEDIDAHKNMIHLGQVGRYVVIGIIDKGVDVQHEAFINDITGESRILAYWDQTAQSGGTEHRYEYGRFWSKEDIDDCVVRGTDCNDMPAAASHGTQVAGVAGSDDDQYPGVAPQALFVVVSSSNNFDVGGCDCDHGINVVDALGWIDGFAYNNDGGPDVYDRPWAANISSGTHFGPHDGTSPLEMGVTDVIQTGRSRGRVVVKSAGNDYFDPGYHSSGDPLYRRQHVTRHGGSESFRVKIENLDPNNTRDDVKLILWVDPYDVADYTVTVTGPSGTSSVSQAGWGSTGKVSTTDGRIEINYGEDIADRFPETDDIPIQIVLDEPFNTNHLATGDWTVRLDFNDEFWVPDEEWNAWLYDQEDPDRNGVWYKHSYLLDYTNDKTITEPAAAHGVLVVGSSNTSGSSSPCPAGEISNFSSIGPTRNMDNPRSRPDLYAPGCFLKTADVGNTFTGGLAGTSLAAPHVTGTAAAILGTAWYKYGGHRGPDPVKEAILYNTRSSHSNDRDIDFDIVNTYDAVYSRLVLDPNTVIVADGHLYQMGPADWYGRDFHILPGGTLRINDVVNMYKNGSRASNIWVGGDPGLFDSPGRLLVTAGATLNFHANGELFQLPGSDVDSDGTINFKGNSACLLAHPGSKMTMGPHARLEFNNGGFLVSVGATFELGANSNIVYDEFAKPMKVSPGTRFMMGQRSKFILRQDGATLAGTAADPIRFEPLAVGERWSSLRVSADDVLVDHVVLEGASYPLWIEGHDVTVRNTELRNNFFGVASFFAGDGSTGSVTLDNVLSENNETDGLWLYGSDASIEGSTFIENGMWGMELWYGTAQGFGQNVIERNGRDGITIDCNGLLNTIPHGGLAGARNRIADNGWHEVNTSSCAFGADFGYPDGYGTQNAIYDIDEVVYELINNQIAGVTVYANYNWWGPAPHPEAADFSGMVNFDYALSGDPTNGSGVSTTEGTMLASVSSASSDASYETAGEGANASSASLGKDRSRQSFLQARMREVREALQGRPGDEKEAGLLWALYALQLQDPSDDLGERRANMALIEAARRKLARGTSSAGVEAMLIEADAMRTEGRVDEALSSLSKQRVHVQALQQLYRADMMHMVLLQQAGDYEGSISVLETLRRDREGAPEGVAMASHTLNAIEMALRERSARRKSPSAEIGKAAHQANVEAEDTEALSFGLEAAHPNPFNPLTVVPFTLADDAEVRLEVYDVLGRRVAVLADGAYPAGRHEAIFDGSSLSSGLYVIRGRMTSADTAHEFTRKVMLVK